MHLRDGVGRLHELINRTFLVWHFQIVSTFFTEQGLKADKIVSDCFDVWRSCNITIYCADFFDLVAADVGRIDAVYDRAALIALPKNMRAAYVRQLNSLLAGPMKGLLITLFYDQAQMDGPPFAVSPDEVQNLLPKTWKLEMRQNLDILEQNTRFLERGINLLQEHVYLLRSRN